VKRLGTPPYNGGGAIIFVVDQISNSGSNSAADAIIRLFGENNAPLTVAVAPASENSSVLNLRYLTGYVDAGIIDVCIDGYSLSWLPSGIPFQTVSKWPEYGALTDSIRRNREQIQLLFGDAPSSCIIPASAFNEANYAAIQNAGLSVVCSTAVGGTASVQPVTWLGRADLTGLFRLPIAGTVSAEPEANSKLLTAATSDLDNLGATVIEIRPVSILGKDQKVDAASLTQLSNLIKSCRELGEITTLERWYQLTSSLLAVQAPKKTLPPYNGGPVIIFRLDDVAKGYREEIVQEIIKLFQKNGVPLDVGVVSNANGADSFEMPWLKQYFDQGAVGISVHGFDWTFLQFDITRTSLKEHENNPCINWLAAGSEAAKADLTYRKVRAKLLMARAQFLKYFGVTPVALTVPTDFFDEDGYRAIQGAGFKIFSVQITVEPYPSSIVTVDYFGHQNINGMYRIPTASDVCIWTDNCSWGDVFDVSQQAGITDYCKYHGAYDEMTVYNDLAVQLCSTLDKVGVAAIGVHPDAFIDQEGKPDRAKLDRLDRIVKWCKSFATIMTFDDWYRHQVAQ
jgi:hypothetical protein